MNSKQQLHLDVISKFLANKIRRGHAIELLGCSERTFRRKIKNFQIYGVISVRHGNSNKIPANKLSSKLEKKIIKLCSEIYFDHNRTHAREKLLSNHNIFIAASTFNNLCNRHAILKKKTNKKRRRAYHRRERVQKKGLLLQMDGSLHRWFGLKKSTLVLAIDDADSEIPYGAFTPTETTFSCMQVIKNIIKKKGKFQCLYVDKAGIYGRDQLQLGGTKREGFSELKRCLKPLGIEVIFAHSPQAKGRVERVFNTLQDRLIPEMRLAGISTQQEATDYFNNHFLPKIYQPKFQLQGEFESAYEPIPLLNYEDHFYMRKHRKVKKDNSIRLNNEFVDIQTEGTDYADQTLEIREYPSGQVRYFIGDKEIRVKKMARNTGS